jgi:uncharacterized protein (TIGR03032 family)
VSAAKLVRLYRHHPAWSEGLPAWLERERVSVVFACGAALYCLGLTPDGQVDVAELAVDSVSAVAARTDGFIMAGWQLWRFVNALSPGDSTPEGHDMLLLPQEAATVGEVGICDVADAPGGVLFASERLGCLARPDSRWSFSVVWTPPWQSALVDEDRCHLGGFTCDGGGRLWVTAAGQTDHKREWLSDPVGRGCIVGTDGTTLATGLTIPRAPRASTMGGRSTLFVAESGSGELKRLDVETGNIETVRQWPAACSALAIHDHWAVVGLSSPTGDDDLSGLPAFAGRDAARRDGLAVVNLLTGQVEGTLELQGRAMGLSSIAILTGTRWPTVAVPRGSTARSVITVAPAEKLKGPPSRP